MDFQGGKNMETSLFTGGFPNLWPLLLGWQFFWSGAHQFPSEGKEGCKPGSRPQQWVGEVWEHGRQPSTDVWVRQLVLISHYTLDPPVWNRPGQGERWCKLIGGGEEGAPTSVLFSIFVHTPTFRDSWGLLFLKCWQAFHLNQLVSVGVPLCRHQSSRFVYPPLSFSDTPAFSPLVFHLSSDVPTF